MTQTLTIPYPDSLPDVLRMSKEEFEQEARLLLAVRLFEEKKITSGQAAEMAGITRVAFLTRTGEFHLSAAMPSPEEILEDAGVS